MHPRSWMAAFGALGRGLARRILAAHGLGGKLVKGKQRTITDGPYAESKDVIGGYTLIEAKDLAEAAELSKGCPILEGGGVVEVRPVLQTGM